SVEKPRYPWMMPNSSWTAGSFRWLSEALSMSAAWVGRPAAKAARASATTLGAPDPFPPLRATITPAVAPSTTSTATMAATTRPLPRGPGPAGGGGGTTLGGGGQGETGPESHGTGLVTAEVVTAR